MTFIDWSDGGNVFDMLVEFVADAKTEAHGDGRRERFLGLLLAQLMAAQDAEDLPVVMQKLESIIQSITPDFQDDPVIDHLTACLEELQRIKQEQ